MSELAVIEQSQSIKAQEIGMNQAELKLILDKHRLWLDDNDGGERADLRSADLRGADLSGANLRGADLSSANLRYANLSDAYLSGAYLRDAYLRDANLRGADLSSANLRYANLRGADLSSANLRYANLSGATGNMGELKSIFIETWPVTYTSEYLQIGCERHLIAEWWDFDAERIERMDGRATDFWGKWKAFIQQAIELSPATPTGHEEMAMRNRQKGVKV